MTPVYKSSPYEYDEGDEKKLSLLEKQRTELMQLFVQKMYSTLWIWRMKYSANIHY